VSRALEGKKGNVVDVPPGQGKTLAMKETLRRLAALGLLPKVCLIYFT
jgi:Fe2+ transport system protein FeoA